jgi:hypothetical protein
MCLLQQQQQQQQKKNLACVLVAPAKPNIASITNYHMPAHTNTASAYSGDVTEHLVQTKLV